MSNSMRPLPLNRIPWSRPSWLRPKYLLFAVIGVMFVIVAIVFERFLIDYKDPEWKHIEPFKWWLLVHGIAGASALILGPMQFSDRLRQRFTKLHRVVGRIYVTSALIAAPMGAYIEYVQERTGATRSFTIETVLQGGLWFLTTAIAFAFILNGKVQQHRAWMIRSFATGPMIFLEVRVIMWLIGIQNLTPSKVETIVWLCTASSIFLADVVLQIQEYLRSRPAAANLPLVSQTRNTARL